MDCPPCERRARILVHVRIIRTNVLNGVQQSEGSHDVPRIAWARKMLQQRAYLDCFCVPDYLDVMPYGYSGGGKTKTWLNIR